GIRLSSDLLPRTTEHRPRKNQRGWRGRFDRSSLRYVRSANDRTRVDRGQTAWREVCRGDLCASVAAWGLRGCSRSPDLRPTRRGAPVESPGQAKLPRAAELGRRGVAPSQLTLPTPLPTPPARFDPTQP